MLVCCDEKLKVQSYLFLNSPSCNVIFFFLCHFYWKEGYRKAKCNPCLAGSTIPLYTWNWMLRITRARRVHEIKNAYWNVNDVYCLYLYKLREKVNKIKFVYFERFFIFIFIFYFKVLPNFYQKLNNKRK